MHKRLFYTLVSVLFLLTPFLIMSAVGTAVSLKYEVEESYFLLDSNAQLTQDQKAAEYKRLEVKKRLLRFSGFSFSIGALLTFSVATGLSLKSRSLILEEKGPRSRWIHGQHLEAV